MTSAPLPEDAVVTPSRRGAAAGWHLPDRLVGCDGDGPGGLAHMQLGHVTNLASPQRPVGVEIAAVSPVSASARVVAVGTAAECGGLLVAGASGDADLLVIHGTAVRVSALIGQEEGA